jgi:gamma-glutamyl:cysteine ligase YbdK (ATP-grasp superfamily)
MGLQIERDSFTPEDHERFSARLREGLEALRLLLARPGFGEGPRTLGAELEIFLVDGSGRPLPVNQQVLERTEDPRLAVELARFDLECNLRPVPLAGHSFTALGAECEDVLAEARRAAAAQGARVVMIGILPTLRAEDAGPGAMTPLPRYRVLAATFPSRRETVVGTMSREDSLTLPWNDITLAGAATSMQYHLRVEPEEFARAYNAAQLASAPVLAVGANSPLLLGRRLWDETRVALYREVDEEEDAACDMPQHARLSFGRGWVRRGAWELFAEAVALHEPLMPEVGTEAPLSRLAEGGIPRLDELRLHHGTVWTWNRAVYDPGEGGHLRLELRALPAGPTVVDMMANGALLLGLTLGLRQQVDALLPGMPFVHARGNFFRAARDGLDAVLLWPEVRAPSPRPVPVGELLERLLPVAHAGLTEAGVDGVEADALLGVVRQRLRTRRTGARWQREVLAKLEAHRPRPEALAAMLGRYAALSESGLPVHEWPLE